MEHLVTIRTCSRQNSAFDSNMKRTILTLCTATLLSAIAVQAGSIIGTVRAEGKKDVDANAGGGDYDSRKFKFAERVDYSELHDFIVYIDQPLAEKPVPPAKPLQVVVQKDASFTPHILP